MSPSGLESLFLYLFDGAAPIRVANAVVSSAQGLPPLIKGLLPLISGLGQLVAPIKRSRLSIAIREGYFESTICYQE
jgi:hypothetical protein